MTVEQPASQPTPGSRLLQRIGWKLVVQFVLFVVLFPCVLFLAAGRLDWPIAWVYVAFHILSALVSRLIVLRLNPELLVERARSLQAKRGKSWDWPLVLLAALIGPLALWIVAGLDERWGWSPDLSLPLQVAALLLVVLGYAIGTWAMAANAYFSGVVRIQDDRGQTVVQTGPYRFVRHPAYAGALLCYVAMPVMLDSLCALVPAALTVAVVWLRTLLEDRTLAAELPGYAEYTRRTRYRLVPGIW
jgi:protein-S-isoprenylcysteine O-methyltransferase Ste14